MLIGSGIFPRIGGKFYLKKTILTFFPDKDEYNTYVEPFIGGGSVYFDLFATNKKNVINDLDTNVYTIYKGLKEVSEKQIRQDLENKVILSKDEFDTLKKTSPTSLQQKLKRVLLLVWNSFFGDVGKSFNHQNKSRNRVLFFKNLPKIKELLRHTTVLNEDYKTVIQKYDTIHTLFYLDPPYKIDVKGLYKHENMNYEELSHILKKLKGMFVLSINDDPDIRRLFKGFNIDVVETRYSSPGKDNGWNSDKRQIKELVIRNFS